MADPFGAWVNAPTDPNEVAAERIRRSVHRNGRQETFPIQPGGPFERTANAMFGPPPEGVLMGQDGRSAIARLLSGLGRRPQVKGGVDMPSAQALRAGQESERAALESAAHWSKLEQAGFPGMAKTPPRTELPTPSPMDMKAPAAEASGANVVPFRQPAMQDLTATEAIARALMRLAPQQ